MPAQEVARMVHPEKLAILRGLARRGKAAMLLGAWSLIVLAQGCSAPFLAKQGPEQEAEQAQPHAVDAPLQLAAHHEVARSSADQPSANSDAPEHNGGENHQPKEKITLPMAIAMCISNNFRVLQSAERIRIAEADLITSSLVPNPSLFADCQLIPLQLADINNQLGPPQWDTLVSVPIDWLLFGKRLAAMEAARLGIEVSTADFQDTLRTQLSQTVDAFYEVLEDDGYFKLAEKNLEELKELQKLTEEMAKDKKVGALEVDRIKLAVHEAILERHDRELALDLAKARLRPFLGRTAADPDYEVEGTLTVTAMVPPPKLEEAVRLADANRPDLISDRRGIDQANAVVELERRRGKPVVAIQPGWTYQDQAHINGFRNGSMFDIGISTTLPLTDRNQGNIRRAQAAVAERRFDYLGDRADALAEVEAALANYSDSVEHLTLFNTPETMKAARDLRADMEAAYRAGTRRLIELLDAQRAYRDRLGHVIEFQSFYWRSLNKLNAAVGLKAYDPEKGPTQPVGKDAQPK
jgi:cobalt-zinc-cadmium efflux system outer membrane protein